MDNQLDFKQIKGMIRRRKKILIITFVLGLILSCSFAFFLPPIYRSEVTIEVEEQEIPEEYVRSTVTGYVEERLNRITQRVLNGTKLEEIINKLGLYPQMWGRYTMAEIVTKMRDDITFETKHVEVMNRRTGRPSNATIAFTLYYEGKNPASIQKVTDILAGLYIQEAKTIREKKTVGLTSFLMEELEELKKQIQLDEKTISQFKEKHIGELPGQSNTNLSAITRLENRLDNLNMQIRSLEERKVYLKGQISLVDPLNPIVTKDGKVAMNPNERLKGLRLQLIRSQSTFSDKHPKVKNLKNEIKELEAQVGEEDDFVEKIRSLKDLEGRLAALKGTLGPKHPDVVSLSKEVEILSNDVDNLLTEKATMETSEENPDNPAYINLMTQIATANIQLKGLHEEEKLVQGKIEKYQQRIENAPIVEQEFKMLTLDYQSAKNKYNDINNKLLEARVSRGMEESQRGERFSIKGPASMSDKPYKPNRIAILLIGIFLAINAGFGLAAIKEYMDDSVKTENEVSDIMGVPVFSVIPLLVSDEERKARRRKGYAFVLIAVIIVGLLAFGWMRQNEITIDLLWGEIQKKLMM